MNSFIRQAVLLACVFLAAGTPVFAASTPVPVPTPNLPHKALHAVMIVEVNDRGQVVRIKGGTLSHDSVFDTMSIGNALQMWIRHPDGSAQTGLFRVTYDYNPKTHNVARHVALISAGGTWAGDAGAANKMVAAAARETRAAYERLKTQEKQHEADNAKHLPDINAAVRRSMTSPSPSAQP